MKKTKWREIIPDFQISIVVQGAVSPETEGCIDSLRYCFPQAQIILSTWYGSDINALNCDDVVFSVDPGSIIADKIAGTLNNVNRQIISTRSGIQVASRPFILKTRTDIRFNSSGFLQYLYRYEKCASAYLNNRLLICNYYTRNPRTMSICFHPSDWIVFGRAEDVRRYYDGLPLMTDEEALWFRSRKKESTVFSNYICRYTPEQHIFLNFLRQYKRVDCDCYYNRTQELIEQTERAMAECFVVLDYGKQLDISFDKYNPNRYLEKHTLISHWQWRALYDHYCKGQSLGLWTLYLFRAAIGKEITYLRIPIIHFLDRLGIKESAKRVLDNIHRRLQ